MPAILKRSRGGVLLALGMAAWTAPAAEGPPPTGEAIVFSDPRSGADVTNVDQLGEHPLAVKEQRATFPAGDAFASQRNLLGRGMPLPMPAGRVVASRKGKDWLGLGQDSRSATPEETMQKILVKQLLKLPDYDLNAQNDTKDDVNSQIQHIYESMLGGQSDKADSSSRSDRSSPDRNGLDRNSRGESDDAGGGQTDDSIMSARSLLGSDFNSHLSLSGGRPDRLLDRFGMRGDRGSAPMTSQEMLRAKETFEQQRAGYRALLDDAFGTAGPFHDSSMPGAAQDWSVSPGPNLLASPAPDQNNPYAAGSMMLNPSLNPALLPPPTPQSPRPASLSPPTYTPAPPRTPGPPPTFVPPQRVF